MESPSPTSEGPTRSIGTKLKALAGSIGPGIFIIGYIIGTGSVTSMASAGAKFGLSLTWALALSCVCTYILVVSISRVTIMTGHTLLYNIRRRFGTSAAIFIILGLMLTVVTSVMGVMGIATDVVREWTRPATGAGAGINPIVSALLFSVLLYFLFWKGRHELFLKCMAVVVAIMGICFVLTMFLTIRDPLEVIKGLVPTVPAGGRFHLILAGMVGTTMASVCIVTRSYLVVEKGWTAQDLKEENRDAIISLSLTFLVSVAIMACAAGTMHPQGIEVERAIDMVKTLEPLAGKFATSLFVFGIVAAALSSLFPNYVLVPWLYFDVRNQPRQMQSVAIRWAVVAVALLGFVVPVFGGRPVIMMIASQAISPIVMPLLIVFVMVLLNEKTDDANYKNPAWLNAGLVIALVFALLASYAAIVGLTGYLRGE